ncbi:hypothetical protein SAMN05216474_1970 [Lishizhenia tianjinensis]|uniref:Uncharacterized protein n=1 Tax=Lishizhenia tianjinensis TaxID=477690 RepID=A0A1I7AD85_9FLAO|nr:hypothetical protein [Lishizhenia tianjinensis]SFT72909.1 hypothetical protein SAMN05216474_1970 [Lishizhenia tianjinensis]
MLYLNLLNRIFGPSKGVSRDDLKEYQQNTPGIDKNEIERASLSDDFEAEAFEGWEGHDVQKHMQSLDNRFAKTHGGSSKRWTLALIGGSALLTLLFIYLNLNTEEAKNIAQEVQQIQPAEEGLQENTVFEIKESNEEVEIEAIENLHPKDLEHTLDRTELVELRKGNSPKAEEFQQSQLLMEKLSIDEVELKQNPLPELSYLLKKEIYLYELKLVDYRPYRKEKMKEEKLVMTGTPASQETKNSNETQNFELKEVDIPYIDYLDKSMYYFSKGMYKKALVRFHKILEYFPEDVNARFYGGLCYYNLNDGKAALDYFSKSFSPAYGNFKEEAEWLSYLTYVDLKQKKEANALLQQIAQQKGFYSERAQAILNKK